jgi:hypothetical protein
VVSYGGRFATDVKGTKRWHVESRFNSRRRGDACVPSHNIGQGTTTKMADIEQMDVLMADIK